MSRSIHMTRRRFSALLRRGAPEEQVREALAELRTKHFAKRDIARERRTEVHPLPLPRLDALPVQVRDVGPHVLHAASPADVRAVLARLPAGTVDGLAGVRLSLGPFDQRRRARREGLDLPADPFTGRLGVEVADGIWCGLVRGTYRPRRALIDVYAHVVADPTGPEWPSWRWILRLEALRTLVHEAAHHHDHACRTARGRWRAEAGERAEAYARARTAEWTRTAVLPYLAARYPDGVELLRAHVAREERASG
ncbi:hypothetical protein [Longimicrobium sp.]|uniref:hypothetical protein n=1 Tax=Longimicrobium sp. TaxID=2029185 RepID=UPI002E373813|nr:hypothetical protein [Longimicrobium sp.]HEX6036518.1 hypothetical protein [Longimicrobium sp.]